MAIHLSLHSSSNKQQAIKQVTPAFGLDHGHAIKKSQGVGEPLNSDTASTMVHFENVDQRPQPEEDRLSAQNVRTRENSLKSTLEITEENK